MENPINNEVILEMLLLLIAVLKLFINKRVWLGGALRLSKEINAGIMEYKSVATLNVFVSPSSQLFHFTS